jgi:hypothetical protein
MSHDEYVAAVAQGIDECFAGQALSRLIAPLGK